jgi:hypothetical protein
MYAWQFAKALYTGHLKKGKLMYVKGSYSKVRVKA